MSIDFTSEIRKILEDHRHFSLYDEQNIEYLVGMIREALDESNRDSNQLELFDEPEDESTRLSGIKYSRYANLSFGDNEITHDGDGRKLDEYVPSHKRRVKSYGFFKNEYYDD